MSDLSINGDTLKAEDGQPAQQPPRLHPLLTKKSSKYGNVRSSLNDM